MKQIDDYFQDVAFSMGFKAEDLLPIHREVVIIESANAIKNMSEKEKQFYINKKMTTLMQRQNNIFRDVKIQIKKRQFTYKLSQDQQDKLQNPALKKILEDHERIMANNKRHIDAVFKKNMIDKMDHERIRAKSNQKSRMTGNSFRSNRSDISHMSNQSIRSNRTSASNRSVRSTTSNKQKLLSIRQKQKEQLEMKKRAVLQKQEQDSKKSLKVIDSLSRKSQRAKIKSTISNQIVFEHKKELDTIKNQEVKDHLQRLKFKIQKTQMIRNKNQEKKEERERVRACQENIIRQAKKFEDHEKNMLKKSRIEEKYKTAYIRHENQEAVKSQARKFNTMVRNMKSQNVRKIKEYKSKEEQQYLDKLKKYEEYRLKTAEIKRNNLKSKQKQRYMERQIKHDIAKQNFQSVNSRKFRQTQSFMRKQENKNATIAEINEVKKKLGKERERYKQELSFQRKSLQVRNYKPKFNSFFDL